VAARRPGWLTWAGVAVGLALLVAAVIVGTGWGRGETPKPPSSPGSALSHVHGMAVNPADGQLYVATHHGVVRVSDTEAVPVGESRQDTMGLRWSDRTTSSPRDIRRPDNRAPRIWV
jgi:DNA-binding beta-propeller fold protein YncE